jgi:DNA-binding MarR family transcriptional regulator
VPDAPSRSESEPPDSRVEQDVLRSLRRIIQAVDLYSRKLASQHGLTGPQLVCLREIRRQGPLNPGLLARSVSLTPPTVSGILDRLEARGLLTRHRRHRDKRQVLVQLTEAGQRVVGQTPPPLQELFTQRLGALPPKRRRVIADVLHQVVELMEAEDIDAAPLLARGEANPHVVDMPIEPGSRRRQAAGE